MRRSGPGVVRRPARRPAGSTAWSDRSTRVDRGRVVQGLGLRARRASTTRRFGSWPESDLQQRGDGRGGGSRRRVSSGRRRRQRSVRRRGRDRRVRGVSQAHRGRRRRELVLVRGHPGRQRRQRSGRRHVYGMSRPSAARLRLHDRRGYVGDLVASYLLERDVDEQEAPLTLERGRADLHPGHRRHRHRAERVAEHVADQAPRAIDDAFELLARGVLGR